MQAALERGLLPDDVTVQQLTEEKGSVFARHALQDLTWPEEPLRAVLIRECPRRVLCWAEAPQVA